MNTAANELACPETQQAIDNLVKELYKFYWNAFGKELKLQVLLAEAEEFVAKYGPNARLEDLF